jgi:arginine exporter protein ArgO
VVQLIAAAVLLAVAGRGIRAAWRQANDPAAVVTAAARPVPTLARFVALTAVNPTTAVYFVVLTAGLGSQLAGPARATAFVAGVGVASWSWQLTLAAVGTVSGERLPRGARRAISLLGYLVVAGYALRLGAAAWSGWSG